MAHDSGDEPSCAVRMEHVHYLAVSHLFSSVILLEIRGRAEAAPRPGNEGADDRQGVRSDGPAAAGAGRAVA